jgi:hypothetical protein
MKGLLLHVAADTSNLGIVGPLFPDGTFEYIPLGPEDDSTRDLPSYKDLRATNQNRGTWLSQFVPSHRASWKAHYDPSFATKTYGEPNNDEPKQLALKRLDCGDYIFFVSSLAPYHPSVYSEYSILREYQKGRLNKYVIGFFEVTGLGVGKVDRRRLSVQSLKGNVTESDARGNQHFRRLPTLRNNRKRWRGEFLFVKGHPKRSVLLRRAIPITHRQIRTSRGGHTFKLNSLGRQLRNRETDCLRGFRWINERGVRILLRTIRRSNQKRKFLLK